MKRVIALSTMLEHISKIYAIGIQIVFDPSLRSLPIRLFTPLTLLV